MLERMMGGVGILVIIGLCLAMSTNRRAVRWRIVITGVLLQLVLAVLVLRVPQAEWFFNAVAAMVTRLLSFTAAGASFLFGRQLYDERQVGFIFVIHVLPTIIFFASFMSVLYYLGVMQVLVGAVAAVMNRVMGVSGAESLSVAANVFVGQTEAPLVVRPFVSLMTRSELMTLMTGGFATIAGSVFGAYVAMLGGDDPVARIEFAKHLLTASLMSAPAAFVTSKIIVPETEESVTAGVVKVRFEQPAVNLLDAATSGAADGLRLAANVAAMLLALLALLAGVDFVLQMVGSIGPIQRVLAEIGIAKLDLRSILGLILSPLAWFMGVEGCDVRTFGGLLGEKIVLTEFVAYSSLADIMHSANPMHYRSEVIATYALCGFANFGSIAIQLGGIGGIAPNRRKELAQLGLRAMIAGALASFQTAAVAGILL